MIDRVGEETKNLFNEIRLLVKSIDTDTLKKKMSRKEKPEDTLAADLEEQLNNLTVEKPVLDADGNVIAWPGQAIDKEKIKAALNAGVLQELLDLATVPLTPQEPVKTENVEAESAETEAEIEVEIIVADEVVEAAEEVVAEAEVVSDEEPEIEVELIIEDDAEVLSEEDAFIAEEAAKMEAAEQE